MTRLSVTKGKHADFRFSILDFRLSDHPLFEIEREPSVDPAFERVNPCDSFSSQQQRHTGAGRFLGCTNSREPRCDPAPSRRLARRFADRRDHLRGQVSPALSMASPSPAAPSSEWKMDIFGNGESIMVMEISNQRRRLSLPHPSSPRLSGVLLDSIFSVLSVSTRAFAARTRRVYSRP